jgi:hypothetical protein
MAVRQFPSSTGILFFCAGYFCNSHVPDDRGKGVSETEGGGFVWFVFLNSTPPA